MTVRSTPSMAPALNYDWFRLAARMRRGAGIVNGALTINAADNEFPLRIGL
jgi:hypothetical protein